MTLILPFTSLNMLSLVILSCVCALEVHVLLPIVIRCPLRTHILYCSIGSPLCSAFFSSPCVVDKSANIKVAGKRIAWGKYLNCGQTCLAPDYVLCNQSIRDKLVESIKEAVEQFYGDVSNTPFMCTCMLVSWLRILKNRRIIAD